MASNLEFILKLTDMLSPGMRAAASISNTSAGQIESQFAKINAGGKKMSASVNELQNKLESVNKVRFSNTLKNEFDTATRAAQRLENQIEKIQNKGTGKAGGGMLGSFVKGNLIASGLQNGLGMAVDFGSDVFTKTLSNKSLTNAINTTTKGQGGEAIAQTRKIANTYGLDYEASLEGVKTLTGGLMSMNMPLKEQMNIFKGVSAGAAALGLNAESSKGAMLALGQMASKGTVSAEELRGQLGERIPGAFGIAAKSMGVTEAKLNSMLQKGEVAAKDFLPRFAAEMEKTFGGAALDNANGPQQQLARFNNAIYDFKTTLGNGLMPVISPILEKLTTIATAVLPWIQTGLSQIWDWFGSINISTETWGAWWELLKGNALKMWDFIKGIAGTIWGILKPLFEWVAKSQMIQDIFWAISKLGEGVFWVISKVGDAIGWVWKNVIMPVLDAIEWVYGKVKSLLGFGSDNTVKVEGTLKTPTSVAPAAPTMAAGVNAAKIVPMNLPSPKANPNTAFDGLGGNTGKERAASINSGGQKSIVIHIGKQIEKLEQNIYGGSTEAADNIEAAVREAMKKVINNINAVA